MTGSEKFVSSIRETLNRIGAINDDHVELFSSKTRDNPNLNVYRDTISNVIFIVDISVCSFHEVPSIVRINDPSIIKSLSSISISCLQTIIPTAL